MDITNKHLDDIQDDFMIKSKQLYFVGRMDFFNIKDFYKQLFGVAIVTCLMVN